MTRQGPFYHYDWTLRRVLPLTALTDLLNAESFVMRTLDVWRDWTRNCEHTEATFFHSVDVGAGGWAGLGDAGGQNTTEPSYAQAAAMLA